MEGDLRARDQQLLKTQSSLREAQEDLARDEVIFGGKVKELAKLREANQQLQVKLLLSRVSSDPTGNPSQVFRFGM